MVDDLDADSELALALERTKGAPAGALIVHLGDVRGPDGDRALRSLLDEGQPLPRDTRCAALLALAKRTGAAATPWLRAALRAPDGVVKDYAVIGLAGAGDGDAWDDVEGLLRHRLTKPRRDRSLGRDPVLMAVAYLGQHVGTDADRLRRLAVLVEALLAQGDSRQRAWFSTYWPSALDPVGAAVSPPDAATLRAWARSPLFEPDGSPLG
jgi:hypothetical protein